MPYVSGAVLGMMIDATTARDASMAVITAPLMRKAKPTGFL